MSKIGEFLIKKESLRSNYSFYLINVLFFIFYLLSLVKRCWQRFIIWFCRLEQTICCGAVEVAGATKTKQCFPDSYAKILESYCKKS